MWRRFERLLLVSTPGSGDSRRLASNCSRPSLRAEPPPSGRSWPRQSGARGPPRRLRPPPKPTWPLLMPTCPHFRQVEAVTSLAEKTENEACHIRTMQRERSSMLKDLKVRVNRALDTICEEGVSHPHKDDDTSHLRFFTEIVTRLEDRAARARELVEERSRGLLALTQLQLPPQP